MQEMHATGTDLLNADDVQRLFGVDRSTIYRMAGDGRLPAVKIGRQWRFPAERITQLLQIKGDPPAQLSPEPTRPEGTDRRIPLDMAQPLIDLVADVLGVMMVVTDMDGHPLTEVSNPAPWFAERSSDDVVIADCVGEWRRLAADPDFHVRFHLGHLDFECARVFIRSGSELIGMVLAGGIAPADSDTPGLYRLAPERRQQVLDVLPKVAATLSRAASPAPPGSGRRGPVEPNARSVS